MKHIILGLIAAASIVVVLHAGPSPAVKAQERGNFVSSMNCQYMRLPGIRTDSRLPRHDASAEATFRIPSRTQVGTAVEEIWVDISLSNNNFASGTFIGAGPFTPGANVGEFAWHDLFLGRRHYYRLNGMTPSGWAEIGRGAFDTPDCVDVIGQLCQLDGRLVVDFGLQPAPPALSDAPGSIDGVEQWIDLSLFNNGFAPRTFIGAGPLPATFTSDEAVPGGFAWVGVLPGRTHYYRINTLYDDGRWRPFFRGSFLSLDCRGVPIPVAGPDDGPQVGS